MARTLKSGVDYFPLDVNIDDDEKIAIIEAEYGHEGFYVIIKLLMRIYGMHGYYTMMTEREQKLFAKRINVDINRINVIIMSALNEKLFDVDMYKEYGILTSKGIQTRYFEIVNRRKEVECIEEYLLIDTSNMSNITTKSLNVDINSKNVDINQENDDINLQSKVKESKQNKIKEKEIKENNNSWSVVYENNISPLTPMALEKINSYLDDGLSEELIIKAIDISVLQNTRKLSYIDGILKNFVKDNIKTLEQFEKAQSECRRKNDKKGSVSYDATQFQDLDKYYFNTKA